jgi:ABC-2 type transport system permease protein
MWKKYIARIKFGFIQGLSFRTEIIGWIILSVFPNIVLFFIWSSVYNGNTSVRGYNLADLLQYFFLSMVISGLTGSHFENWRAKEIRDGKIDFFLTRPFVYPFEILFSDLGSRIFYCLISLPIFFISYFALSLTFSLATFTVSLMAFIQFILFMFFAYLVEFCFALFAVFLSFWFEGAEGLEHFKWISITVFSGAMIPLAFMPQWLQGFVNALPFKYMYAFPIALIQHRATMQVSDVMYMLFTLLLSFLLLRVLWSFAIKKYASSGG